MSQHSKLLAVLALAAAFVVGVFAVTGFAYRKEIVHLALKATPWEVRAVEYLIHPPSKGVGDEKPSSSDNGS